MDDKEKMKQGFQMLLEVPLDIDDEDKYISTSVGVMFTEVLFDLGKLFCILFFIIEITKSYIIK